MQLRTIQSIAVDSEPIAPYYIVGGFLSRTSKDYAHRASARHGLTKIRVDVIRSLRR
jgi:hypothetical protein